MVFGSTIQEHNENLKVLLDRLRETGLKLHPDPWEYLIPELKYLGHLITAGGVKSNLASKNLHAGLIPLIRKNSY